MVIPDSVLARRSADSGKKIWLLSEYIFWANTSSKRIHFSRSLSSSRIHLLSEYIFYANTFFEIAIIIAGFLLVVISSLSMLRAPKYVSRFLVFQYHRGSILGIRCVFLILPHIFLDLRRIFLALLRIFLCLLSQVYRITSSSRIDWFWKLLDYYCVNTKKTFLR